jgi:hypothetical protein
MLNAEILLNVSAFSIDSGQRSCRNGGIRHRYAAGRS